MLLFRLFVLTVNQGQKLHKRLCVGARLRSLFAVLPKLPYPAEAAIKPFLCRPWASTAASRGSTSSAVTTPSRGRGVPLYPLVFLCSSVYLMQLIAELRVAEEQLFELLGRSYRPGEALVLLGLVIHRFLSMISILQWRNGIGGRRCVGSFVNRSYLGGTVDLMRLRAGKRAAKS